MNSRPPGVVESAALPEGTGPTINAAQASMLIGGTPFDVYEAINRGELKAHKPVDGGDGLILARDEATAWVVAWQTEALAKSG